MRPGNGAIKVKSLSANARRSGAAPRWTLKCSKQANLAFNNLPFKNIPKMITACVNSVRAQRPCAHTHTHTGREIKNP